jgi:NAD(P)-dependent dehydrogenase (short-subunit alcohol dehydrogenase family)
MSKAATSRLTESLQGELAGTGVRVVAIEPGFFATEIYAPDKRPTIDDVSPYASMVRQTDERIAAGIAGGADPAIVAEAIVAAVDDPASPTRILVGDDAVSAYDTFRVEQLRAWQTELDGR